MPYHDDQIVVEFRDKIISVSYLSLPPLFLPVNSTDQFETWNMIFNL